MKIPDIIRDYAFVPSGETVRAAEIVVLTAAIEVIGNISSLTDVRTYAIAAGLAGVNALLGFVKGQLKAA
jgi:hypothetical protein